MEDVDADLVEIRLADVSWKLDEVADDRRGGCWRGVW